MDLGSSHALSYSNFKCLWNYTMFILRVDEENKRKKTLQSCQRSEKLSSSFILWHLFWRKVCIFLNLPLSPHLLGAKWLQKVTSLIIMIYHIQSLFPFWLLSFPPRFTVVYNPLLALVFVSVYWIIGLLHAYFVWRLSSSARITPEVRKDIANYLQIAPPPPFSKWGGVPISLISKNTLFSP